MWGETEVEVLAIFLADIHLSLKAPLWRSAEPDWLEAQFRPLEEVRALQDKYKCPVICAGDIFDRNKKIADGWNAPAELINYAINYLPDNMYAIPGQHDLPNHQYDDIHRSAYQTLVKAGKICDMKPDGVTRIGEHLVLCAYPPGYGICPVNRCEDDRDKGDIWIAVVHDYVWIQGHSYPKAPQEKELKKDYKYNDALCGNHLGYNVIVYGDNHKGFGYSIGATQIFNCGTLTRRKSDEIDYKPQVGLLLENGNVAQYYLDTSEDKYLDTIEPAEEKPDLDMSDFFDELEKLGKTALDFRDAMKQFLHNGKTSLQAKQIILKAMEK